jgi:hypothetical protein
MDINQFHVGHIRHAKLTSPLGNSRPVVMESAILVDNNDLECPLMDLQEFYNGWCSDRLRAWPRNRDLIVGRSFSLVLISGKTVTKNNELNQRFWEELIAYFPIYDTGHTENDDSNNSSIVACVFVIAVTFLPSRCLATIGRFLSSCCLATIRGFLPSRCLATIGGIHRHMHTATWSHKPTIFFKIRKVG